MAAIALAACGGGDSKPAASQAVAAPNMTSQAARLKEIKSITLTSDTAVLDTGVTGSQATLTATAFDAMGQPIPGVLLHFDPYTLSLTGSQDVETDAKGVATAKVSSAGVKYDGIQFVEIRPTDADFQFEVPRAKIQLDTKGSKIVPPESPVLRTYGSTSLPIKVVGADGIGMPDVEVVVEYEGGILVVLPEHTNSDGVVWLNFTDETGTDHSLKFHSGTISASLDLKLQPLALAEIATRFHETNDGITTGKNDNGMTTMVHVTTQGKPVVGATVAFSASNGGFLSAQTVTTDSNGTANISVSTGSDLSNRAITLTAEVSGSTAQTTVYVRGTTLTTEVAPLMTLLGKPVWKVLAKDGAGNPIVDADIQMNFALLPAENSNEFTPIDPTTFTTVGATSTSPNPKLGTTGSAVRTIRTNASGVGTIEFGTPTAAVLGKVMKATGTYGAGKQAFSAKQHIYAGTLPNNDAEVTLTSNLVTDKYEYRYMAKEWHRLFLTLDLANLYEAPNAKGPTSRNDKCDSTFSQINVRANGQNINLRSSKLSNSKTCPMNWGGDFFGKWNVGRRGFAASDFHVWYDANDNKDLPAGIYIAPMRLSIIESDPDSGNDIFWGYKEVVVYVTKK